MTVPDGWYAFPPPPAQSTTQIWVRSSCIDTKLTEMANEVMATLKENMLTAKQAWGDIEQRMILAGCTAMEEEVAKALEELHLHDEAKAALEKMAMTALSGADAELKKVRATPDMKLLKKIQAWFQQDKLTTAVICLHNEHYVLLSAHGESMGSVSRCILALAQALHRDLEQRLGCKLGAIVGMDANTKATNEGAKTSPDSLNAAAAALGFVRTNPENMVFAGTQDPATLTVLKTRTFLQCQLFAKAGIPDENKKDWIFMKPLRNPALPPKLTGRVLNDITADSPEGRYLPGGMPCGRSFPSDHALVICQCHEQDG